MLFNFYVGLIIIVSILPKKNASNLRIVDGTDANPSEFPFMISLQYKSRHYCGGTILNRKFILTAAHCVCDQKLDLAARNFEALVTHSLTNIRNEKIPIENIICHPFYSSLENINDVAILELHSPIPKPIYHPVTLSSSDFDTRHNQMGMLLGWGSNQTDGEVNTILQKVDVLIYNDTICKKSYFSIYNMDLNMCAGWPEDGRASCQGDSGGPLVCDDNIQVGIISRGANGNCSISNANQPKILLRISKYLDWIHNNANYTCEENDTYINSNSSSSIVVSVRYYYAFAMTSLIYRFMVD